MTEAATQAAAQAGSGTGRPRDRRAERRLLLARAAACAAAALGLVAAAALWGPPLALAAALAAAAGLLLLGHRGMRRPGATPVLVYHSVSPDASWLPWGDNISVRPETFRLHMAMLDRMGRRVIPTAALIAARREGRAVDPDGVVLHFDDGYLDNYLEAAPVLRAHGFPATIFASADFIDPSAACRDGAAERRGYMNRAELRALDADPLFEIAAHGLDHGRVPVSQREVGRLEPGGWRLHAPQIWALTPGPKARWFEAETPAPLAFGDPLRETDSKLCGCWLRPGGPESPSERDARVEAELRAARLALEETLGRPVDLLCWPFDRWTEAARAAARRAGFAAFTGGRGENRPGEDPEMLSRVHVHDRAFGGGPLWLEGLAFRARVAAAGGDLYAALVVMLAAALRARRLRRPGAHA